jgi:Leu/Phe-tRNA-protein transferase
MSLRYTSSGYIVIVPEDDPDRIVDGMLSTAYSEEFCLAWEFEPAFVARLMAAGFLVMSAETGADETERPGSKYGRKRVKQYLLLPKLHLIRSALFFENLHVKKSIKRFLRRYELRLDGRSLAPGLTPAAILREPPEPGEASDFDRILDRCVHIHGEDWLTPPLRRSIRAIRGLPGAAVRPVAFGLYRDGELKAGEIGVVAGRVYTSYSGYYDEDNAGTVQMVLMTQYLRDAGFAFLDLGMPLPYKNELGAVDIDPGEFTNRFRAAGI